MPLRRPLNGALMDFKWPTRLNPPFAQSFISDYIRRNRLIAAPHTIDYDAQEAERAQASRIGEDL
jgi:hypothetical protein